MFPKHFLQAYSRMLHLKKKRIRDGNLTNVTKKQAWKYRQCTLPDRYGFKICEKLTHCAGAMNIRVTMWLFLKSTHLVHPCTPHQVGTTLENSGTPGSVRYTRLTSTALYNLPWRASVSSYRVQCNIPTFGAWLWKSMFLFLERYRKFNKVWLRAIMQSDCLCSPLFLQHCNRILLCNWVLGCYSACLRVCACHNAYLRTSPGLDQSLT